MIPMELLCLKSAVIVERGEHDYYIVASVPELNEYYTHA
jgi:hypothetical protein